VDELYVELSEQLPPGQMFNSSFTTSGEFVDPRTGHNVSYNRELNTSINEPGKDITLVKHEEQRVDEQPADTSSITRQLTTKYYKKKTVLDGGGDVFAADLGYSL